MDLSQAPGNGADADLTAAVGTPVKAFTDGTVESIHEDPLMGYTVVLDHGNGIKSTSCRFGHTENHK